MNQTPINVIWLRRDLRIEDNTAIETASRQNLPILLLFIFDESILNELPKDDARVNFIYKQLEKINHGLAAHNSSLLIKKGEIQTIWKGLTKEYNIHTVFCAKDYEPYAIQRDKLVSQLLSQSGTRFEQVKDQVIFEENDILKADGTPYTVYTPYKNKWLEKFYQPRLIQKWKENNQAIYFQADYTFPSRTELGFKQSNRSVKPFSLDQLKNYQDKRDYPGLDATSYLSPYLRFGSISIRQVVDLANQVNQTFLSELIWREFFMQILYHFPRVVSESFKPKYDNIQWINNEGQFQNWCKGQTGYPIVDAGMRQLNQTGYMHNRVRMVTASFLCKHLLIDWRWGEAYFASKLLDYELSSNNGNWQWAAGCGCDAAPYFRVFNPSIQLTKFDKDLEYVKKWIPELLSGDYPTPIVDHSFSRLRAIEVYKAALQ
ncbi:DNA photolyase family protein [Reichenbachiella agarivorans]|uniref:DNA photolyase family protein n=1 Tax=Reichenbachiella agarivorans TaxID=2979464 RepID=A0ABY6CQ89_9BACT|nr:deoxyribodipyrimidine photo-lyase [Reichenbachiella agarivorans]UXP32672.1 DNA photolyase family protein [Reichenbachiella agarivorans]